jgi:acetyl esterase/lipase
MVLAGDSAGGGIVAAITQRLLEENQQQPILQILIYPWIQLVNSKLPSYTKYNTTSFIIQTGFKLTKMAAWYLGLTENVTGYDEFLVNFEKNNHFGLIEDEILLKKYKSYLDPNKIPDQYKKDKSYYKEYESIKNTIYPNSKLDMNNVLLKNNFINTQVKKLFHREISPLLADDKYLIGLPKAYFIILEWDELKDEGLLYAERLKENNVNVSVRFYEKGFHGIMGLVGNQTGLQAARDIQKDLIEYMKLNL